jgi:HTH-type transcriptional regulator, sugar sensing transcriptional regulator
MEQKILENLGFTHAESKVYLTLLELGPVKVGKIIEKSGLQSSTIQYTLISLINKGFVTYVLKGKIKIYQSVDPKIILKEYKEREKQFEDIIPLLEGKQKLVEEKQEAEIYEGWKGIHNLFNELIKDAKPGEDYYFYSVDVDEMNKRAMEFFATRDAKRKEKRLNVKGLARSELKSYFKKRKNLEIKFADFPIPININLYNNKMVIVTWTDKPTGILIKSKQIVESQIKSFNQIWDKLN